MRHNTRLALASARSSEDFEITGRRAAALAPPLRRCNSDSPETPRVSASYLSLQEVLAQREELVARALAVSREAAAPDSDDDAGADAEPEVDRDGGACADVDKPASEAACSVESVPIAEAGSGAADVPPVESGPIAGLATENAGKDAGDAHGGAGEDSGAVSAATTPRAEPVSATGLHTTWASPSEMSPAIRELLQPAYIHGAGRTATARQETVPQGTVGQGTLDQYASLRRKLWRPPDMEAVIAAIPDMGMPSDCSGYISDVSQRASSAGALDDSSNQPTDVMDRGCVSQSHACLLFVDSVIVLKTGSCVQYQ